MYVCESDNKRPQVTEANGVFFSSRTVELWNETNCATMEFGIKMLLSLSLLLIVLLCCLTPLFYLMPLSFWWCTPSSVHTQTVSIVFVFLRKMRDTDLHLLCDEIVFFVWSIFIEWISAASFSCPAFLSLQTNQCFLPPESLFICTNKNGDGANIQ